MPRLNVKCIESPKYVILGSIISSVLFLVDRRARNEAIRGGSVERSE